MFHFGLGFEKYLITMSAINPVFILAHNITYI